MSLQLFPPARLALPDETVLCIIRHTPPEKLGQLKTVSKAWNAFISCYAALLYYPPPDQMPRALSSQGRRANLQRLDLYGATKLLEGGLIKIVGGLPLLNKLHCGGIFTESFSLQSFLSWRQYAATKDSLPQLQIDLRDTPGLNETHFRLLAGNIQQKPFQVMAYGLNGCTGIKVWQFCPEIGPNPFHEPPRARFSFKGAPSAADEKMHPIPCRCSQSPKTSRRSPSA